MPKSRPTSDQEDAWPMSVFLQRVGENPGYLAVLMSQLELNQIEAKNQKYDEPAIFRKKFDDLGLVVDFKVNPKYRNQVPKPRTQFGLEEGPRIFNLICMQWKRLNVMLLVNQVEASILEAISKKQQQNAIPIFRHYIGADGIPTACQLNIAPEGLPKTILAEMHKIMGHPKNE